MSKNKKTYQGFKVDYLATKILISTSIHFSVTQFQIIVLLLVKTLHSVDWNGWRKQIFWAIWELLISWESEASIQSDPTDRDINNYLHLTQQIMNGKYYIHEYQYSGVEFWKCIISAVLYSQIKMIPPGNIAQIWSPLLHQEGKVKTNAYLIEQKCERTWGHL